jgi:hypothetical protein
LVITLNEEFVDVFVLEAGDWIDTCPFNAVYETGYFVVTNVEWRVLKSNCIYATVCD